MRTKRSKAYALASVATIIFAPAAGASDTITYGYDALGRLILTTTSGGPNNGIGVAACFDAAGNRTRYTVGSSVTACGTGSTPTPTPTSTNQPPVAVADSTSGPCNAFINMNVIANDYDPDGNTPLSLVSVTGTANVDAQVVNSTTVQVYGNGPGIDTLSYVVKDSLGATATGTITYHTTGTVASCNQ